jgi:hypothetical protein
MTTYPDDADGAVLADLAAQGVDMSQPLLVEFAVHASDETSAHAIAEALAKKGYDAQIDFDEGEPDEEVEIDPDDEEFGPSWTVYAEVTMVPAYEEIVRIQAELDQLAGPFDGHSDGWGVMIG